MRELEKKREQMQHLQQDPAGNSCRWNGFAVSVADRDISGGVFRVRMRPVFFCCRGLP